MTWGADELDLVRPGGRIEADRACYCTTQAPSWPSLVCAKPAEEGLGLARRRFLFFFNR